MKRTKKLTPLAVIAIVLVIAAAIPTGYIAISRGFSPTEPASPSYASGASNATTSLLLAQGYVPGQFLVGTYEPVPLPGSGDYASLFPNVNIASIKDLTDLTEFEYANVGAELRVGRQILLLEVDLGLEEGDGEEALREATADTVQALESSALVRYAEPNYIGAASGEPNDPYFAAGDLWGMDRIQVSEAWDVLSDMDITLGSDDNHKVVIGILDTGIDYDHHDLSANVYESMGYNFLMHEENAPSWPYWHYSTSDPMDDLGHGTHVAGIIGAVGDNGEGIVGICRDAIIVPLKIWDGRGLGSEAEFIRALAFAEFTGIPILNLSGGWYSEGAAFHAMEDAVSAYSGLIIAAAGNHYDGNDVPNVTYPAAFDRDNVISVAASHAQSGQDELCDFSSYDSSLVDLVAPGEEIWSTVPWGYAAWRGSSMAASHVTGVAALLQFYDPNLTAAEIKAAMVGNTDDCDDASGASLASGRLTAFKAIEAVETEPGEILPTGVELGCYWGFSNEQEVHIRPYDYVELEAIVYPANATNQTVTWSWSFSDIYDGSPIADGGVDIQVNGNELYLESIEDVGEVCVNIIATTANGLTATCEVWIYYIR